MAAGNLASRPYAAAGESAYAHRPTSSDSFVREAEAALAVFRQGSGDGRRRRGQLHPSARLKRLVFNLDEDVYRAARPYWMVRDDDHDDDRVCGLALAHPAASQLEQLVISCESRGFCHRPRLESLRCGDTLRLLDLKHCNLDPRTSGPSASFALPSLTDLLLHHCDIAEGYLQVLVEAATALANLEMKKVRHKMPEQGDSAARFTLRLRLRCPTLTAFVLDNSGCYWDLGEDALANGSIELDMPSLRTFRYDGYQVKLSLTSPTPALEQTDLRIWSSRMKQCEPVSRMLGSFSSTRGLRLRNQDIEDIIVAGEEDDILPTFPNLKILVLEGCSKDMNNHAASAMVRLLRACPVISELRLSLPTMSMTWNHGWSKKDPSGLAFRESMDRFKRFVPMDSVQGSNDIGVCNEISELTTLSSSCTLSSLRKVTLRFEANELNCFPVQLAKFLAENAMDLEEMHVDDGSQFWADHVYNNVSRWRADSFRRKNLPDTGRLQVYYLLDGYSPRSSKDI